MFGQKTQPAWFFDSSVHLEAVSRLLYLVENHEPLGVVLGPDGSGRTRVLSRLREELMRNGTQTVNLNLSGMDEEAALWQLTECLALRTRPSMRRFELMSLLRDELAGRARCDVQTVILLDDLHRAIGDLNVVLRVLNSLNAQCRGMLTVVAASAKALPAEFAECSLVPIRLTELDTAESSDFVRSLIGQQVQEPSSVDESAVRAISITSVGNAARMSRLCSLLRVVHEASPETRITEETVYSLLTEFSGDQLAPGSVMRAS
jgi:general secretion pathway protein A